ncbi:MAG: exodeoxyribonuclease VII large subunit, partial [Oscillospiraceae bacterium]
MRDVITVTALNKYVKTILEKDSVLDGIAIRGEISNFVNHFKTGHFYFTVKDGQCSVKAVMFKSDAARLAFMPQNGMNVILRCRVSLFERDGAFQLYVEDMFPDGVGAMQLAFEQMKERLEKEGLFKAEYKKS